MSDSQDKKDKRFKLAGEGFGAERREEYAALFEQIAREIREGGDLPEAVYVMIGWDNGKIGKAVQCEPGFSAFHLIGILDCLRADLVRDVIDEGF